MKVVPPELAAIAPCQASCEWVDILHPIVPTGQCDDSPVMPDQNTKKPFHPNILQQQAGGAERRFPRFFSRQS